MGPELSAHAMKAVNCFAFGPFELIPGRRLLLKDGKPVRIGGRAFDILTVLVRHQGNVVSKRQVMAHAWPGAVVDEGNLKVNVAALRRVLGEDPDQPRYIATVVGRGYRFITPVRSSYLDDADPISSTLPRRANNLPTRTAPIFGRAAAIGSILHELETTRLVSIVGPGGIGKTTVALAVAHEATASFEDGAWLVDLSPLNDQSSVADAVSMAIGLDARPGHNPAALPAALHDHLRDRKMLLLLDNCEHLIDAVASWADRILASVKHVNLLITSREPLCIKGERVRRLFGLNIPPASSKIRAADALEFAAVQLFVDRASGRSRSFRLDDANAPIVSEICRRMDGLALGIERIAMRADTMDVGKMLDHIDNRFHMLDGYHAGPERHRTLTAAIDWNYNLLSEDEQAVMRRLSTFAGDFSLEPACAVAADVGVDPAGVVEDVASLVAKSLLTATARQGEMDYRLTNIARAFGRERLVANGEFDSARRRHAEHVLAAGGAGGSRMREPAELRVVCPPRLQARRHSRCAELGRER
jgi:predicted ATPase/DNA-binding winged helix-turn-helix (wHTH) protein